MTAVKCGIIFAMMLFIFTAILPAQEQEPPQVLMKTSAVRPAAGTDWLLTLLIAHNEPNDVNVIAPHFSDALFLDQVLKGPRHYNPATGESIPSLNGNTDFELWTAMEYRFMLSRPETVEFESFTVITPLGQVKTEPFTLLITDPPQTSAGTARQNYRLAWEGVPAELKTGESAVISLRITNRNSALALPPAEMFMPLVPPGHIVESLPLPAEETAAGKVLSLRIIPLAALPFTAARRQFSQGMANFEVPAIRIPVRSTPRAASPSEKNAATATENAIPEKNNAAALFPPMETAAKQHPALYKNYRTECDHIYGTAKNLWERGYIANALVLLRQNERDHRAGALFSALRREAEQAIGLAGTNDEKARNLFSFFSRKPASAVLKETSLRRIPDMAGEEIARCREGQPILAAPLSGRGGRQAENAEHRESWRRIITNDSRGLSGWVLEENIIFY